MIDRGTGTTFYALTSGGLFKTTDSGSSWTALGNIAGVNIIGLDPTSSSTVYAGTVRGVVKTTDGGRSWSPAGLSNIGVRAFAIDPHAPSTLYANGAAASPGDPHEGGNIYKSVDGGASWTSVSLGFTPVYNTNDYGVASIAIDPLTPSPLYVLIAAGIDKGGDIQEHGWRTKLEHPQQHR